jgi:signal transduction histidine kinase
MNPWSFIPFSSFLINTVLAAVVFGLNPGSKTNRAYSLFAVSFAFWGFLNFIEWNGMSPRSSRLFIRIDPLSWMASTLFVLNFIYVLVQRRRDPIFRLLTAIVAAWSIIAVTTGGLFTGFRHAYWGEFAMVTRFYFSAVVMSVLLPAVWGFYILIKTFKVTRDLYFREQLKYLTIGTLAMFIVVFTDSVFRTELIGNDSLPFLGSFFLIIQSGFIFFAIVRHRFLNVDVRNAARELFSKVHEGVVILDQNQGIIDLNASAQEFFGMTKDDKPVELERIFGKGYRFDENCKNREITCSHGGTVKTGVLSQSDLFDHGRLVGKMVMVHDITKQREEERKRAQLEYNVLQSHASRLESLGTLAGGFAHDFNNMLSGMIGYATILRLDKDRLNEKQLSYAENILNVGRQAADLTKKLMTFARRNVSEMAVFSLHEMISETVSLLEHTLGKKIKITVDLQADPAILSGDRVQIQNMLFSMAINARDAMPQGGELRFTTRNVLMGAVEAKAFNTGAEGGGYIVVDVEDTGSGMTGEVMKKIFDPFFTTKQPGKGTGLGLSSAYGIVASHKGFIRVDSTVGQGTVFHNYFPITPGGTMPEPQKKSVYEKGNGCIVLVDDEVSVRTTTTRMLEALGYSVVAFDNGEDAVKWYREQEKQADLVLLDVMMPGMTGDQCAEVLQKINPGVKIIFISGYPGILLPDKLGVLSVPGKTPLKMVRKPFTLEQLSQIVKQTIGQGSGVGSRLF